MASGPQTLALAVGLGALVSLVCLRLRIPAVLPLLITGLALGRSGIGLVDGAALNEGLPAIIAVAIGVLIFEGSLHLDRGELARAPRAVRGLLTIGAAVTWVGAAGLAHFGLGLPRDLSLVLGAILIVTGPTVVQPILRRVRLTPALNTVLSAEAILIDPIGVVATVATLEVVLIAHRGGADATAWSLGAEYLRPLVGGILIGAVVGAMTYVILKAAGRLSRIDEREVNLLAMAACMTSVGLGEWVAQDSGLVAVTVCGVIVANARVAGARELRKFKEQLSGLLVGALFILLASRLDIQRLKSIGVPEVVFVAGLLLVVRPVGAALATIGSGLNQRERIFIMLFAPRGIVAASVASIAAAGLAQSAGAAGAGDGLAEMGARLETVTLLVIFVSVTFCGVFAAPMARLLGVAAPAPNGALVIGAHRLGRELALAMQREGLPVRIVDANPSNVALAVDAGLPALIGDATDSRWLDEQALGSDIGWVLALTGNAGVDAVASRWAEERLGPGRGVRWSNRDADRADAARPGGPSSGPRPVLSAGRPLRRLLDELEAGAARVEVWSGPRPDGRACFALGKGLLRLVHPGDEAPPETRILGVTFSE